MLYKFNIFKNRGWFSTIIIVFLWIINGPKIKIWYEFGQSMYCGLNFRGIDEIRPYFSRGGGCIFRVP